MPNNANCLDGVSTNYQASIRAAAGEARSHQFKSERAHYGVEQTSLTNHNEIRGSGANNGTYPFSRLSKIDFPQSNGENVQGWIYKCEQFFEVEGSTKNVKVKLASIKLNGKALLWHQSFIRSRNGAWPGWNEYKQLFQLGLGLSLLMIPWLN